MPYMTLKMLKEIRFKIVNSHTGEETWATEENKNKFISAEIFSDDGDGYYLKKEGWKRKDK